MITLPLFRWSTTILVSSSLFGCAAVVKTPYQRPNIDIPTEYQYSTATKTQVASIPNDTWWTLFADTQLNQLIQQVLQKNSDLVVAGFTLQQARLQAGLSSDQQGIRVNSSFSTGHSFDLNSGNDRTRGLTLNGGVSYELDLFGKLARQTEASQWEALATAQDLQATAQSLVGNTAKLYWQLGYFNERYSSAEQSLSSAKQLFQLVKAQYKAGAVSGLELTQAEQAVQSQRASLKQIQQQRIETRTALAVLLHEPVQQLQMVEPQKLPTIQLPKIQAGLPAELLARRPDLQAAELRLRKTLANKDATKAKYYPSISLTGNLGSSSTSLSELLKNPLLTLGANLSLPFLQINDMKKDIKISDLEYQKAIVQYRQTMYQAFADVENALSNRVQLDQQVTLQQRNVTLAEKAERLTQVRYKHGAIPLKNVLDAQETTRNARLNLIETKQNQYNAYVTLFQALGGSPITASNPPLP